MARTGLVYLRPISVIFFRAEGPYRTSSAEAWSNMLRWLDSHGLRARTPRGYGLSRDNPRIVPAEKCRYDACIELPTDIDVSRLGHFEIQKLPGGAYARQRHVGCYSNIRTELSEMRDRWAPQQGLALDARRPLVTIFLNDPKHTPEEQLKADVCLPVMAATGSGRTAA